MLYSNEISNIIKNDLKTQNQFLGCFSRDNIPELKNNTFIIINTDPKHKPGEHWIVLYKNKENIFEFFDSLGRSPNEYKFKKFPRYKYVIHNLNVIQNPLQNTCGYFCLYYIFFKSRGYDIFEIVEHFSSNFNVNDLYIKLKIEHLYNINISNS